MRPIEYRYLIFFLFFIHLQIKAKSSNLDSLANLYHDKAGSLFEQRASFDSVMYYAKKALNLYSIKKDSAAIGSCYLYYVRSYARARQYDKGLVLLDSVYKYSYASRFQNQLNRSNMIKYYYFKGYCYYFSGKTKIALAHFENYIDTVVVLATDKSDKFLNSNFHLYGVILNSLHQYEKSIRVFQKALEISPPASKAKIFSSIANLYNFMGLTHKAILYNKKALTFAKNYNSKDITYLSTIYLNIGGTYLNLEDYDKALLYLNKSGIINNKNELPYTTLANYYEVLGLIFLRKEKYLEAAHYFKKTASIYEEKYSIKHPRLIFVYKNLGHAYLNENMIDSSSLYYKKALDLHSSELINNANPKELSQLYNSLSLFYMKIKNYDTAKVYLDMSLKLQNKLGPNEIAEIYLVYGNLYEKLDDNEKSLYYYSKSLQHTLNLDEKYNDLVLPPIGKKLHARYTIENIINKAGVLNKLYIKERDPKKLIASINHYEKAINLIILNRNKLKPDLDKKFFFRKLYKNCSKAFLASYSYIASTDPQINEEMYNKAFIFVEQAKNITLKEKIQSESAIINSGVPKSILEDEQEIRNSLIFYKKKKSEVSDQDDEYKKLFSDKQLEYEQKYDSLIQFLETKYSNYFELKYNNKVVNVTSVQNKLKNNESLIEYFLVDKELFVFVINKNDRFLSKIPLVFELDKVVKSFREAVLKRDERTYLQTGYKLYQTLIEPVKDKINGKKLTVIPDSYLGYLSFEILLTEEINNSSEINYKELPYLINNYQIKYQYSATTALNYKENTRDFDSKKSLLAFAPEFTNTSSLTTEVLAYNDTIRGSISELPGAVNEVNVINKIFNGSIYLDQFATERNFREKSNKYKILHLATHAIVDDENPSKSKLIFSLNDTIDDGYLHSYELYGMNINAELVTLSACNTGFGKIKKGEGVMSLARGFAYAGCPNLVMSLWPASDRSTSNLMKLFYENLSEGMEKDEALHKAKLSYIQESNNLMAHPYYWGSFVFVGNSEPLTEDGLLFKWLVGVPLFIIFLIIIYLKKSNRA